MTRAHWLAVVFVTVLLAACLALIATAPVYDINEPLTPQTVAPAVRYTP